MAVTTKQVEIEEGFLTCRVTAVRNDGGGERQSLVVGYIEEGFMRLQLNSFSNVGAISAEEHSQEWPCYELED